MTYQQKVLKCMELLWPMLLKLSWEKSLSLIKEADRLFQQLQQIKVTALGNSASIYNVRENCEADFALERGLYSLLVGEIDERRSWLGLNNENSPYREPSIANFVMENSRNDPDNNLLPGLYSCWKHGLLRLCFLGIGRQQMSSLSL